MAEELPKFEDTEPVAFEDTLGIDEGTQDLSATPSFDETSPVKFEDTSEPVIPTAPESRKLEALTKGIGEGLTFGMADELGAATQTGADTLMRLANKLGLAKESPSQVSERLAAQEVTGDVGPIGIGNLYRTAKGEQVAERESLEEQHPYITGLGEVTGALAIPTGVLGISSKAAKGASTLAKVGKAAAAATAEGAAYGLGKSEADLTKGEIKSSLKDTLLGGLLGGVTAGTITGLSGVGKSALKSAEKGLQSAAERSALSSVGAKAKDIARELGKGTKTAGMIGSEKGVGKTLLENDLIKFVGDPQKTLDGIESALSRNQTSADNIVNLVTTEKLAEAITLGKINPGQTSKQVNALATELRNQAANKLGSKKIAIESAANSAEEFAKSLSGNKDIDINALQKLKKSIGEDISQTQWFNLSGPEKAEANLNKQLYSIIKDRIEMLAEATGEGLGKELKNINKQTSNLITAKNIAFNQLVKDQASSSIIGIADVPLAGLGAVAGGGVGAGAAVLAKKALEAGTGKSLSQLGKVAAAKGLTTLAKASSETSATSRLLDRLGPTTARITSATRDDATPEKNKEARIFKLSDAMQDDNKLKLLSQEASQKGYKEISNVFNSLVGKDRMAKNASLYTLQTDPTKRMQLKELIGDENYEKLYGASK